MHKKFSLFSNSGLYSTVIVYMYLWHAVYTHVQNKINDNKAMMKNLCCCCTANTISTFLIPYRLCLYTYIVTNFQKKKKKNGVRHAYKNLHFSIHNYKAYSRFRVSM